VLEGAEQGGVALVSLEFYLQMAEVGALGQDSSVALTDADGAYYKGNVVDLLLQLVLAVLDGDGG